MSRVVVTDGEQRAALAVVRSLGARGHEVYVCSASGRSLAGASRFCRGEDRTAASPLDADGYAAAVKDILERREAEVLIPIGEPALRVLLPAQAALGRVKLPFPAAAAFELVSDKRRLLEVAALVGARVPRQRVVEGKAQVDDVLADTGLLPLPAAVKPSRSPTVPLPRGGPGVAYAADVEALRRVLSGYPREAFPLLVQERVEGPGVGIFLLMWDGVLRAHFAHRRIREKPPSGGVSVCRESGEADPALLAISRAILDRVGWRGVAMVEFKLDARSGAPVVMEVNGRFWGSLQLAVDAGVDFPALLLDALEGRPPPDPAPVWRTVRSRWLWGEADHLLARIRGMPRGPTPSGRSPFLDRLDGVGEVMSWRRGDRTEVLRRDDLGPFLRESLGRVGLNGWGRP